MWLKIEPNRLIDMLNVGLIGGLLDDVVAEFTPNGVMFRDKSLNALIVYANYKKEFFPTDKSGNHMYKVDIEDGIEKIVWTKYMQQALELGYKKDELVEMYTEGDKVYVKGKKDLFDAPLQEPKKEPFEKMKYTKYGFYPTSEIAVPKVLFKIDPREVVFKTAEICFVECSENSIKMRIEYEDTSRYTRTLEPTEYTGKGELSIIFDGNFLSTILKLFSGDIWCGLNEHLGVFCQTTKTHAVTFVLATREV